MCRSRLLPPQGETGPAQGVSEREETDLSWSLHWTMSLGRGMSSKRVVPDNLAALECHKPGITGHLPKVNHVACP